MLLVAHWNGGKTLFLKTPPSPVTGYKETKLVLTWKFQFYWLVFIALLAIWTAGGDALSGIQQQILNTTIQTFRAGGITGKIVV